jgi:hypothetical protein
MKKLLILMLALGAMACEYGGGKHIPSKSITEDFDRAFDGDYRLGFGNAYMLFEHFYNEEYGYWGGFALSKMCDSDPANGLYENQYSVYNTQAASGDGFLLYYYDSYNEPCDIVCMTQLSVESVKLNLTTYTYSSITNEDINSFASVFGDGDYLKVIFTPYSNIDTPAGASVECYVVDYRDGKRFVADNWQKFELNLPATNRIRVTIETTDIGEWGANTPLYICMDDLTYMLF